MEPGPTAVTTLETAKTTREVDGTTIDTVRRGGITDRDRGTTTIQTRHLAGYRHWTGEGVRTSRMVVSTVTETRGTMEVI